jgi:hypothetical protein
MHEVLGWVFSKHFQEVDFSQKKKVRGREVLFTWGLSKAKAIA